MAQGLGRLESQLFAYTQLRGRQLYLRDLLGDRYMNWVVKPETFRVLVGASSRDI